MSRQQLLDDIMVHVRARGLGEFSLRELADVIGSSHRMLLYHFGSRAGLLAAIVTENERRERAAATELASASRRAPEALRAAWRRLRQPSRAAEERLFFELAAMAMYHRPGAEGVADEMFGGWLRLAERSGADPSQLRLDLAVTRGLLLDLLVTGDRAATDAAMDEYIRLRS
jgi:AcrR family transcriptional regulator